jgi:hypothetical protein
MAGRWTVRGEDGVALILELILASLLLGAVAIGAVRLAQAHDHPPPASIGTGSARATSPNPTHTVASNSYAGWQRYRSPQESSLSFLYPPAWRATAIGSADPAGDGLQLTSPNGTEVWWQSSISGLGGVCPPNTTTIVTSVDPLQNAPSYFVLGMIEAGSTHYGVIAGPAPTVGTNLGCPFYTTFPSKFDPNRKMAFESNGMVVPSDTSTVRLILQSFTY